MKMGMSSENACHNYGACGIWLRRITNVNEIVEIKTLLSEGPKNFQLAVASHWAALSGNWQYIVNCHRF